MIKLKSLLTGVITFSTVIYVFYKVFMEETYETPEKNKDDDDDEELIDLDVDTDLDKDDDNEVEIMEEEPSAEALAEAQENANLIVNASSTLYSMKTVHNDWDTRFKLRNVKVYEHEKIIDTTVIEGDQLDTNNHVVLYVHEISDNYINVLKGAKSPVTIYANSTGVHPSHIDVSKVRCVRLISDEYIEVEVPDDSLNE